MSDTLIAVTGIIVAMFGSGFLGQWIIERKNSGEKRKTLQETRETELNDKLSNMNEKRIEELTKKVEQLEHRNEDYNKQIIILITEISTLKAKLELYEKNH